MVASDINSKISKKYASKVDIIHPMNHVFEHIIEPYNFLSNLRKNITKNAKVVILMPNSNSIWRYIFKRKMVWIDPPILVHLYRRRH